MIILEAAGKILNNSYYRYSQFPVSGKEFFVAIDWVSPFSNKEFAPHLVSPALKLFQVSSFFKFWKIGLLFF